jgi:hypothetical protein
LISTAEKHDLNMPSDCCTARSEPAHLTTGRNVRSVGSASRVALPEKAKFESVAVLYRSLRKGREDGGDAPGTGDFYYGQMEMWRLFVSGWRGSEAC